jgi:hypothetical protein
MTSGLYILFQSMFVRLYLDSTAAYTYHPAIQKSENQKPVATRSTTPAIEFTQPLC